jgi:hypothetical protein
MSLSYTRAPRSDGWNGVRQPLDPSIRRMTYGPIRPMEEDGAFSFLRRLFHRP